MGLRPVKNPNIRISAATFKGEGLQLIASGNETFAASTPHLPQLRPLWSAVVGQSSRPRAADGHFQVPVILCSGFLAIVGARNRARSTATGGPATSLRIPRKLDICSIPNWTPGARQTGHLGRDGAGSRCGFTPDVLSLSNWRAFSEANLLSS